MAQYDSLWRDAARTARYFGCATSTDHLSADIAFANLVLQQCDVITPEYQLKWNAIEYAEGQFNYVPVDEMLIFCRRNRKVLRGHTLLWDQSTPTWAKSKMLLTSDWSVVSRYFADVLGRYGNYIREWDVINEPIDTQTGIEGLRQNTFFLAYGPGYIERALREARAFAPKAELLINDYSMEYANPVDEARRAALLKLLRSLKAANVPLDGVGIQAHLDLSKGPFPTPTLREFFRRIADLGLFIVITELDVKEKNMRLPTRLRDALVASETARYLDFALSEPVVRGVVTWGLSDKYSWLSAPGVSENALNRGLPYDDQLVAKPMYSAISNAFATAGG